MNTLELIGKQIIERSDEVALQLGSVNPTVSKGTKNINPNTIHSIRLDIVRLIGECLTESKEVSFKKGSEWGEKVGELAVTEGIELDATLVAISVYKKFIWQIIYENIDILSKEDMLFITRTIDDFINHTGTTFSLAYSKAHRKAIQNAYKSIQDLSTPVVPITNDIAVLPLIGAIDDSRSKQIMEIVLNKAIELRFTNLIVDLSGVPEVDEYVAGELFNIMKALKLVGVTTTITGISPKLAQMAIRSNIDFGKLSTKSTLKQALEIIFKSSPFG